jgi:hypothetical protein
MQTLKYLRRTAPSGAQIDSETLDTIRRFFYRKGIKTSFEDLDKPSARIIFSNAQNNTNKYSQYNHECNGLILEIGTWRPLVLPIPAFATFIRDRQKMSQSLARQEYTVHDVIDGTIINMYYWADKWVLSTANGYEVNHLEWGGLTYDEAFAQVLEQLGVPDLYESLDKAKCYTFGFKHPSFHPFWEDQSKPVYKLWFVQDVCLKTLQTNDSRPPRKEIRTQKLSSKTITNVKDIFSDAANALRDYMSDGTIFYGYILKPVTSSSKQPILIESSLLKTIKKLYYNRKVNQYVRENGYDRAVFMTVRAFLNDNYNLTYNKLFPQFRSIMTDLVEVRDKILDMVLYLCDHGEEGNNVSYNVYGTVAKDVIIDLKKCYNMTPGAVRTWATDNQLTIRDFITHESFVDQYYMLYRYERALKKKSTPEKC